MYLSLSLYIYIYILRCCVGVVLPLPRRPRPPQLGRGDDTVGDPHRARISQFEFFELSLLLKLDKRFPVEQLEATVSQSTVPPHPLDNATFALRASLVAAGGRLSSTCEG